MSIFHRRPKGNVAELDAPSDPDYAPRMVFPRGPFASLMTAPADAADLAYAAFMRHEMTPVVAEREIVRILTGCVVECPALDQQVMFQYALAQEPTSSGRLRVLVHWLVQLQNSHETNRAALRTFERSGNVRRVMVMPGCCPVCDKLAGRRFRMHHAPDLPVHGCERHGGCICAWAPALD